MTAPARLTLHSGYTVLCGAPDGSLGSDPRHGLFDFDTRILSRHELAFGGRRPELVSFGQPSADRWQAALRVRREGGSAGGPLLPQDVIEMSLERAVGPVMAETIDVVNHSAVGCAASLALALDADFADVAAVAEGERADGEVSRGWLADEGALELRFIARRSGRTLERDLRVRVAETPVPANSTPDGLVFDLHLPPRGALRIRLAYESLVDGHWRRTEPEHARRVKQRRNWQARRARLEPAGELGRAFDRAAEDLFDLRNWELERRHVGADDGAAWVLNAGIPSFSGLFGRDTLTAGWQSALLGPRVSLGALAAVAATQSTAEDPWRDAEPGKMIHEARRGPNSELGLSPRDAYYGSQTTPHMFLVALVEAWLWSGDDRVLARHAVTARKGLSWADQRGDLDGDGLLEYQTRSPKGLRNQGWKDSDEAIRHADGSIAEPPIATVEEQAFYYTALQRMAAVEAVLGDDDAAGSYLARAAELRARFHEAFWMADEGFYALALDGSKRQVRSITSNPGHALASGIVPAEHAATVAERLMADDLFSGWGIRTLSDGHPSYNPFAYHLGSVWPVEQATFALGFKRYGLDEQADRLATAVLEAAALLPDQRLPEALSGHSRTQFDRPVLYPDACSPQAWSASATIQLVQVMLGLYPFAPLGVLAVVRPHLPEWAESLSLRNLRVGRATLDLRFDRRPDGTASQHVERRRGAVLVLPAGPPQALAPTPWEAIESAALANAPGRLMRAARILLGME